MRLKYARPTPQLGWSDWDRYAGNRAMKGRILADPWGAGGIGILSLVTYKTLATSIEGTGRGNGDNELVRK